MDEISVESVPSRKKGGRGRREGVTGPLHKNKLIQMWSKILNISNAVICNLGAVKNKHCLRAHTDTHMCVYFDEVITGSWRN